MFSEDFLCPGWAFLIPSKGAKIIYIINPFYWLPSPIVCVNQKAIFQVGSGQGRCWEGEGKGNCHKEKPNFFHPLPDLLSQNLLMAFHSIIPPDEFSTFFFHPQNSHMKTFYPLPLLCHGVGCSFQILTGSQAPSLPQFFPLISTSNVLWCKSTWENGNCHSSTDFNCLLFHV